MSVQKRSTKQRILDIWQSIVHIEHYLPCTPLSYFENDLIKVWVLHHLQIIGEAMNEIDKAYQEKHPNIPWSLPIGTRHILVHHYYKVNHETIWSIAHNSIPELRNHFFDLIKHEEIEI